MGNWYVRIVSWLVVVTAFSSAGRSQAITEYGSMAKRSATVAAKGNNIAKGIRGVWNGLDAKVQGNAGSDVESHDSLPGTAPRQTSARSASGARSRPPAPAVAYEDPRKIQAGTGYEELIRRFGPASFEVTTGPGAKTLSYSGKDGSVDLEVKDGKVTKVAAVKAANGV